MSEAQSLPVWAVVVAAGSGERLGADRPKAYVRFAGRTLLAASLEMFEEHPAVDGIVVVVPEGWEERTSLLADDLCAGKIAAAVAGGATRAESVREGLEALPDSAAFVLVHDAARPLAPPDLVDRVLRGLAAGADGVVPALPLTDTVKRVDGERVLETRRPQRAGGGADAAGLSRGAAARGDRAGGRRPRRGDGLRVAGRARRRSGRPRRGRPGEPQGDDEGRPAPRGAAAGRPPGPLAVLVDYHMHLADDESGLDAAALAPAHVARYVEQARARGLEEICVTEHLHRFAAARDLLDQEWWQAERRG